MAAGVDGAPEAPSLSVLLRPDRQSRMRPVESESGSAVLSDLVLDPPTAAWPLAKECRRDGVPAGDPGATRALNWLPQAREETKEKLGLDPRAAYPVQPFDKAGWDGLVTIVHGVTWDDVPEAKRDTEFTRDQFLAGQCQLETELHLVGNVRDFLTHLASPIADTGLLAYSKVLQIGDKVYKDVEQPDAKAALRWTEFAEILLELAGPLTHEVSSTIAGVMELGVWMFGADENGGPAEELPFEARKLGAELVAQMTDARDSFGAMGDTIVTDSAKLAYVGLHGGCLATETSCPKGWSFTVADREQRAGRHPPQRRADRLRGAAAARVQHLRAQRGIGGRRSRPPLVQLRRLSVVVLLGHRDPARHHVGDVGVEPADRPVPVEGARARAARRRGACVPRHAAVGPAAQPHVRPGGGHRQGRAEQGRPGRPRDLALPAHALRQVAALGGQAGVQAGQGRVLVTG